MSFINYADKDASIAEGVQQPYEISVVTGLEEAKAIYLSVSAYPNPVINNLILTVENFELSALNFQMYDMQGQLLRSEKITGMQTRNVMSNLASATYFVKITKGDKEVRTFKIVKN